MTQNFEKRETMMSEGSSVTGDNNQTLISDVGLDSFMRSVIEASQQRLVIVDFWAPWCGPCKQLVPLLEKMVSLYGGKVSLAKINVDREQRIAQQMGVQSVPAVFAFHKGQPVDGFMGALPEPQIKTWLDALIQKLGVTGVASDDTEGQVAQAEAFFSDGDFEAARGIFLDVLDAKPDQRQAFGGVLRCLIASEKHREARAWLDKASPEMLKDKDIQSSKVALEMIEESNKAVLQAESLEKEVVANPGNHQARFDLAMACYAIGQRERTVDLLLDIIQRDRMWNDDAARKQLVKLFEALGSTNPLTVAARKRLSSILFS